MIYRGNGKNVQRERTKPQFAMLIMYIIPLAFGSYWLTMRIALVFQTNLQGRDVPSYYYYYLLLLFIQPFQQYMTIQKILPDGLGETKAK